MKNNESEKKKKIRQLENDIENMKRDHAKTFGYPEPEKKSVQVMEMLMFVAGIVCLSLGLFRLFSVLSITTELAALSIGRMKLSGSIFSMPLVVGIISFIICKNRKIPFIVTAIGAAVSFAVMLCNIEMNVFNKPLWVYCGILLMIAAGLIMSVVTFVKIRKREKHS